VIEARSLLVRRASRLGWFTVGWNVAEGVIAISAALAAGSQALLGFGLDSGIESISASILLWRWWADPIAALCVVVFLVREGRQAFSAEHVDGCC
jgi:divalent metal cation (Fe/Co/Zn/Cd) transporter